jgi:hypothetical protein
VKIRPEDADGRSDGALDMVGVDPAVRVTGGAVAEWPGEPVIDPLGCGDVVVVAEESGARRAWPGSSEPHAVRAVVAIAISAGSAQRALLTATAPPPGASSPGTAHAILAVSADANRVARVGRRAGPPPGPSQPPFE